MLRAFVCAACAAALGFVVRADVVTIDLLLAFDASAKVTLDLRGQQMRDFAQEQVDRINLCLANSGLSDDVAFRLAGVTSVSTDTSRLTLAQILSSLQSASQATGDWKSVWQARDDAGADLFAFVTGGNPTDGLGYGYQLLGSSAQTGLSQAQGLREKSSAWRTYVAERYCFNVVSLSALLRDDDYTLAHECGHNLGCNHVSEPGFYAYSQAALFGSYVTVMGYGDATHVVAPVFSSPDVRYAGFVTGSETCDNAQTIRENAAFVAAYRAAKTPTAEEDGEEAVFFTKAVTRKGVLRDSEGSLVGAVELKIAATNKKKLTSKVTGSITRANGKKCTLKGTVTCTRATPVVICSVKGMDDLELTLGQETFSGRMADGSTVAPADVGGAFADGTYSFDFGAPPESVKGNAVLTRFLPVAGESFEVVSGKFRLAKAAVVKYKKGVFDQAAYDKGVAAGKTNLSGLKLSYTPKTGLIKGSFSLYTEVAGTTPKLKKVTIKVTGLVAGGECLGEAALTGLPVWRVGIR